MRPIALFGQHVRSIRAWLIVNLVLAGSAVVGYHVLCRQICRVVRDGPWTWVEGQFTALVVSLMGLGVATAASYSIWLWHIRPFPRARSHWRWRVGAGLFPPIIGVTTVGITGETFRGGDVIIWPFDLLMVLVFTLTAMGACFGMSSCLARAWSIERAPGLSWYWPNAGMWIRVWLILMWTAWVMPFVMWQLGWGWMGLLPVYVLGWLIGWGYAMLWAYRQRERLRSWIPHEQ